MARSESLRRETPRRPLQNRVDPFGVLHAVSARGTLMGNRGGRFHRDDQTLGARRFVSRRWIACVCSFKDRHRDVWGAGYTELFFLDEPTALAAGHRPCFECRRKDALAFLEALGMQESGPRADELDLRLHQERLQSGDKRLRPMEISELPDGAMIVEAGGAFLIRGDAMLAWRFEGYEAPVRRPMSGKVAVVTPPLILEALRAGYRPRWA